MPGPETESEDLPPGQGRAYDNQLLEDLTPLPDSDGDPTSIEAMQPNGIKTAILVNTSKPELFEGVDIDEFAAGDFLTPGSLEEPARDSVASTLKGPCAMVMVKGADPPGDIPTCPSGR